MMDLVLDEKEKKLSKSDVPEDLTAFARVALGYLVFAAVSLPVVLGGSAALVLVAE